MWPDKERRRLPDSSSEYSSSSEETSDVHKGKDLSWVRICSYACGCITLVVALLILVAVLFLGRWVKQAVEDVGPLLTGTNVTVGGVNANLFSGGVTMRDLRIASPPGYQDDLMAIACLTSTVNPLSLFKAWRSNYTKPFVLEQLSVVEAEVFVSTKSLNILNSNAQEVLDHMQKSLEGFHAHHPKYQRFGLAKVRSRMVEMSNMSARVKILFGRPKTLRLETIHLADVGLEGDGVHVYELFDLLMESILQTVIKDSLSKWGEGIVQGIFGALAGGDD